MRVRRAAGSAVVVLVLLLSAATADALTRSVDWVSRWEFNEHVIRNGGGVLFEAASRDATRVIFKSPQRLTHSDQDDTGDDLYESVGGKLRLLSVGTRHEYEISDYAEFAAATPDARTVAFTTDEDLTSDDRDYDHSAVHTGQDVYVTSAGRTRLVSKGPNVGRGEYNQGLDGGDANASLAGASRDLRRIFFTTDEQVVAADRDDTWDVYLRAGGKTTFVSPGADVPVGTDGVSVDGRVAFLTTDGRLTSSDRDEEYDVFQWRDGKLRQVTRGPLGGNGNVRPGDDNEIGLVENSEDGRRAWFYTAERLTKDDRDARTDLYEWADGRTRLVSTGPAAANGPYDYGIPRDVDAKRGFGMFRGASPDGRRVYFTTSERLTPDDRDAAHDLYERSGGHTRLLTPAGGGPVADRDITWAELTEDGERIFLTTRERLTGDDRDRSIDVYEIGGGDLRRISTGPRGGNHDEPYRHDRLFPYRPTDAYLTFVSNDHEHVFFSTMERLADHAQPDMWNLYEIRAGRTSVPRVRVAGGRLVSMGKLDAYPLAASRDAGRFVFYSGEPLVRADRNEYADLYAASLGEP